MKIEHIALWTFDLEKIKNFYVRYFGGRPGEKYHNEEKGFESYFLSFDSGARLEIMTITLMVEDEEKEMLKTGFSHIAFSVGSKEKVDDLTDVLRRNGYMIVSEPRLTGDGYYESCVLDPDGNRVEITV